ncbi:hypothetical protein BDK92_6270 [Micromonospora pisi]|uniref:Uncharacterized protein n=1 Tax=Micromonospora pisi TaxID=589240 RepID=A0A495JS86_9ACTN|nr:hypothetical protein BDK92_6270 [Micromonospora pisi]
MDVIEDLEQLAARVRGAGEDQELYVRWSRGPMADLAAGRRKEQSSRDALTGVTLPGLSANPLRVEPWWGNRSVRLWVARRLYDYRHLRDLRRPGASPWVFVGEQCGRGPDNEPLVICHQPIAWVSEKALQEADVAIREQHSDEWGPLHRSN